MCLKVLLGISLGLLLISCKPMPARYSANCVAGSQIDEFVSDGQTRQYLLHIPAGYRPEKPTPFVIGFHGNGSTAGQFEEYTGWSALADQEGFIAVYPQGLGEPAGWDTWTGSRDVVFVSALQH
jgi:poly(3-hydroxybutyrate) depolymerase